MQQYRQRAKNVCFSQQECAAASPKYRVRLAGKEIKRKIFIESSDLLAISREARLMTGRGCGRDVPTCHASLGSAFFGPAVSDVQQKF
jgi:hypothetical protein